jgi:N-acetylmuramoyl-L-alanine amidase
MPAVLIEAGFLTNPKEEDYLNTEEGQSHIASAIFRAFRSYYNEQTDLISEVENLENKVEIAENINDSVKHEKVVYKVQIGTYLKSMLSSRTFNKIKDLEEVFVNGSFKYYISCGDNKKFADDIRKNMIDKGFSGSFVTAFYKGKQISTKEALNLQKKYE